MIDNIGAPQVRRNVNPLINIKDSYTFNGPTFGVEQQKNQRSTSRIIDYYNAAAQKSPRVSSRNERLSSRSRNNSIIMNQKRALNHSVEIVDKRNEFQQPNDNYGNAASTANKNENLPRYIIMHYLLYFKLYIIVSIDHLLQYKI